MKPPFSSLPITEQLFSMAEHKRLSKAAEWQMIVVTVLVLLFSLSLTKASAQVNSFPYTQSFEESFTSGTSVLFLPNWWGNEVSSDSRIYASSLSHSGSKALAAEPTTSFVAEMRLRLDTRTLNAANLHFWARSAKNGSGSRPSLLLLSFSSDGGTTFSTPVAVGTTNSFPNADTDYQRFTYSLPPELLQNPDAVIRWQVRRSEEGAGTAALVLLDDVLVEPATLQLQLLTAEAISATELLLTFSHAVEKASAEQLGNYSISPVATVQAAQVVATNNRQILLQLSSLAAGNYTLTASNIRPADGGEGIKSSVITFTYQPSLHYRDLVINEIFADPNPKGADRPQPVVLPDAADAEFIELFNASTMTVNLQQLQLSGGKLPDYQLQPGSYVILVPAGKEGLYAQYGDVAEVQGWKSLSNSGTTLQLLDTSTGRLIDSLSYTSSWYQQSSKTEGGWSLEQTNPYLQCSFPGNWRAATATKGATPGEPNSVLDVTEDLQAPQLLQAVAAGPQQLVLLFDEYLSPTSSSTIQVALQPSVPIESIRQQGRRLLVNLAEGLQEANAYEVAVTGVGDCSGNILTTTSPLIFPKAAQEGELLINEIMYNPTADGAEWVELYNPTNHYLNLQGWYLGLRDGTLKSTVKLSDDLLLLAPKGYLVFTANPAAVATAHPQAPLSLLYQLKDFPNLRNSGDTLVLLNPAAELAEIAPFSDARHHPLVSDSKGVSLERISPALTALTPANWTSAAAPSYSTPGMPNSQHIFLEPAAQVLRIDPQVLEPTPDGVADVTFIHYQLTKPGLSGTLLIFDASGREVQQLASNQLLGQEGVFQWNGTNAKGERVSNGYYIVVLSVFSTDGYQEKWRKTLVVSSWL